MTDDVASKVKKIVADHLGIDEAKVTEEANFIDDLGADSLDTVELVMSLPLCVRVNSKSIFVGFPCEWQNLTLAIFENS